MLVKALTLDSIMLDQRLVNQLMPALLLPLIVTFQVGAIKPSQLSTKLENTSLPIQIEQYNSSVNNWTDSSDDRSDTQSALTPNSSSIVKGVNLGRRSDIETDSEVPSVHSTTDPNSDENYMPRDPSFLIEDLDDSNYSRLQMEQNSTMNDTKAKLREECEETIGCTGNFVQCRNGHCKCQHEFVPDPNDKYSCTEPVLHTVQSPRTDPTMIGVVIGLALMSVTLCVVMRLFAKARFRENRTIFNTANPRLMNNVTSKKISKQSNGPGNLSSSGINRTRRGSQISFQSGDGSSDISSYPPSHPHMTHSRSHPQNGPELVASSSATDRGPPTEMELQMKKFERLEAGGYM